MKSYEQVLEIVELALTKGEYQFCVEFLNPIIESYPLSSKEGANLRTILITALCGLNKKDDAKKICKDLLKSYEYTTRENAKYLMEIIDSPEIKKPENWSIKFETNPSFNKKSLNSLAKKKSNIEDKKFINLNNTPTGETKPFKKGFTLIIFLIFLLLIPLLSGCVKIENALDLRDLESINNYLTVESKYIDKFPWQIKFEEQIKDLFPDAEISIEDSNFSLKNKNLNIDTSKEILKKIQYTAGKLAGGETYLDINTSEKNLILYKKFYYRLDFDLKSIEDIENLEINFKIMLPNRGNLLNTKNDQLQISKKVITWDLIPGQLNTLEFTFWSWNKLLVGITFVALLMLMAYLLRFYRFKIGTDLPQLPSE